MSVTVLSLHFECLEDRLRFCKVGANCCDFEENNDCVQVYDNFYQKKVYRGKLNLTNNTLIERFIQIP